MYALLTPAIIAIANILDKFIMSKKIENVSAYYIIVGVVYVIITSLIFTYMGFPRLDLYYASLFMIMGLMLGACIIIYFKAMQIDEVSRLIALNEVMPLFIAILAFLFLDERFTLIKYIGVIIIVVGGVIVGIDPHTKMIRKVVLYIMPYIILLSVLNILDKYMMDYFSFWEVYSLLAMIAGMIMIVFGIINNGLKEVWTIKRVVGFTVLSEILTVSASLIYLKALSLGPVTLVSSLSTIQPLYVLLYATILSVFFPNIIKEVLHKKDFSFKITGTVLITIGAILLTINI